MKKPSKDLAGRRIRLIACNDTHTKLPSGSEGTVDMVDDMGTLHVNWDDGDRLSITGTRS
jgi:Domain of unknown function (DUF4314)